MVLYPNKLPESERVCSGICSHGGIYLCGLYIVMPQHLADGHYRHARFKNDERGKRVISKLEQNA